MTMAKPIEQHTPTANFLPHILVRHRHLQTVLLTLHRPGQTNLRRVQQEMILETAQGVRLQGFFSPQPDQTKGIVLLLHGWLGCAESNYNTLLGEDLYRRGYAVFRVNYRDHGDTHQLNPGFFRGDLLDELFDAAQQVARLAAPRPLHIIGVSLGGSFALRLAWRHAQTPIPTLGQTIAINPAINPRLATLALDRNPLYLHYFRSKWRASLKKKQALFPDRYDFAPELAAKSCMAMTETLMPRYSPHPDAQSYFNSYQVTPAMLAGLTSPVTILTAADDPIVPVADFHALAGISPYLTLDIQPYGGHVGFIDLFPFRTWITEYAARVLGG
ncbi:MAG: alpha/beta fold hydrolase [Anaerolineales bacterium]|nr:alpha/beta fold hydrolase [Anaerolineales bacterium]